MSEKLSAPFLNFSIFSEESESSEAAGAEGGGGGRRHPHAAVPMEVTDVVPVTSMRTSTEESGEHSTVVFALIVTEPASECVRVCVWGWGVPSSMGPH